MIDALLCLLIAIGLGLLYVLIDCARSLRDSREVNRHVAEILEHAVGRHFRLPGAGGFKELSAAGSLPRLHGRIGARAPGVGRFAGVLQSQSAAGFAVWVYREDGWHLEENHCLRGFHPGPPPDVAGQFPGDRVRKEGIPEK